MFWRKKEQLSGSKDKNILDDFVVASPINHGWSVAKKFKVHDANGQIFFVKIIPNESASQIRGHFKLQKRLYNAGIPIPQPLDVGICNEGYYIINNWVEGTPMYEYVLKLPANEQYAIGEQVGHILKKLHDSNINMPMFVHPQGNFAVRHVKTFAKRILGPRLMWWLKYNHYLKNAIKIEDCSAVFAMLESYLKQNIKLLPPISMSIVHGDFQMGNMLINKEKITIVDFSHDLTLKGLGASQYELARAVSRYWNKDAINWALGLIHAYFGCNPSDDTWRRIAYYSMLCVALQKRKAKILNANIDYTRVLKFSVEAATMLHNFNNMSSPVCYRGIGEPTDDIQFFQHFGCEFMAKAHMYFSDDGYVSYCPYDKGVELSTPKDTMARYWMLRKKRVEASLNNALAQRSPDNDYCVGCSHYRKSDWHYADNINFISANAAGRVVDVIAFAQQEGFVAP